VISVRKRGGYSIDLSRVDDRHTVLGKVEKRKKKEYARLSQMVKDHLAEMHEANTEAILDWVGYKETSVDDWLKHLG